MEIPIAALIAAVIGSSGLVGAITVGVQHSRATRLRRSVREALELSSSLGDGTRASNALRVAADRDAYRLAALTMVRMPGWFFGVYVAAMLVAAGISGAVASTQRLESMTSMPIVQRVILVVALTLVYAILLAAVFVWIIEERRDALVRRLMRSGEFGVTSKGFLVTSEGRIEKQPGRRLVPLAPRDATFTNQSIREAQSGGQVARVALCTRLRQFLASHG